MPLLPHAAMAQHAKPSARGPSVVVVRMVVRSPKVMVKYSIKATRASPSRSRQSPPGGGKSTRGRRVYGVCRFACLSEGCSPVEFWVPQLHYRGRIAPAVRRILEGPRARTAPFSPLDPDLTPRSSAAAMRSSARRTTDVRCAVLAASWNEPPIPIAKQSPRALDWEPSNRPAVPLFGPFEPRRHETKSARSSLFARVVQRRAHAAPIDVTDVW